MSSESLELVLASTSPYRRKLLDRLGVPFQAVAPQCDEESFKRQGLSADVLALTLAEAKARSVAEKHKNAFVLGSDQVAEVDGQILDKPGSVQKAVDQLCLLSGRTHRLVTAMVLKREDRIFEHVDVTELTMRPFTRLQAERYVAEESPLDCAGSYRFESAGIRLFRQVDTNDPTAIIGLPLLRLGDWLTLLGFTFP